MLDVGDEDMIIIGDDVITCVRRGEGDIIDYSTIVITTVAR